MIKKHLTLIGSGVALLLLLISTFYYPGGSQADAHSVGFSWQHNYVSNLLRATAVNGEKNSAQPWAIAGLCVLCLVMAVSFVRFSEKIHDKGAAKVIKYAGIGAMFVTTFAATPLHDLAIPVACTLLPLTLFYITIFVLKSRLRGFKIFAPICLVVFYASLLVYTTRTAVEWLPILQKAGLLLNLALMLGLEYFSKAEDFEPRDSKVIAPLS